MRNFTNDVGCNCSFDDNISDEQIKSRLSFFGNSQRWREVKE